MDEQGIKVFPLQTTWIIWWQLCSIIGRKLKLKKSCVILGVTAWWKLLVNIDFEIMCFIYVQKRFSVNETWISKSFIQSDFSAKEEGIFKRKDQTLL